MARRPVIRSRPASLASADGFTLIEVLLAVSTLAVVAVLCAAALRVGIRAWEAGQRQTDAQQETRAIVEVITEALKGAYPYRGRLGLAPERVVLFEGDTGEVRFITTAPSLAVETPGAPFHAVVLGRTGPGRLHVLERLVPTDTPFEEGTETVLSRAAAEIRFAYRDETGAWRDRWSGRETQGIPTAVRVELKLGAAERGHALPPMIVSIALGKRQP